MHRHIITLILFALLALPLGAHAEQGKNSDSSDSPATWAIQPGQAVGPLMLGMSSAEVARMAGPPSNSAGYDQLRQEFSQMGTPVDQYNLFINGFDVGEDYCSDGAPLSFGQVFYRDDAAIHLVISSWCAQGVFTTATTQEGLGLGSSYQAMIDAYGPADHQYMDNDVGMVYDYLQKGITFVISNDRVDLIEVYIPSKQ